MTKRKMAEATDGKMVNGEKRKKKSGGNKKKSTLGVDEEPIIVDGFTVLPIKYSQEQATCHYLYCKAHSTRSESEIAPPNKTLFVVGVPPYCTDESLQHCFGRKGIEKVTLSDKPNDSLKKERKTKFFPSRPDIPSGFRVAYIVFKDEARLQRALQIRATVSKPLLMQHGKVVVPVGMDKWCAEYVEEQTINPNAMQREIDKFMTAFDMRMEKEERLAKKKERRPEEDGWITVTKEGKNKGHARTEANEKRTLAIEKRKRHKRELLNFYTFQIRESKKERIAELRKKFEADKEKIAELKSSRRFRPF